MNLCYVMLRGIYKRVMIFLKCLNLTVLIVISYYAVIVLLQDFFRVEGIRKNAVKGLFFYCYFRVCFVEQYV